MKIGIMAIQGDYEAHAKTLDRLGVEHTFVRRPEDLAGISGIILPGGESTTHLKVMTEEGLFDAAQAIRRRWRRVFRHLRWSHPACSRGARAPAGITRADGHFRAAQWLRTTTSERRS